MDREDTTRSDVSENKEAPTSRLTVTAMVFGIIGIVFPPLAIAALAMIHSGGIGSAL